ncbi:helix-turn-helix transcriptional regulator [Budviciaceae bacterium CWB-B4]|uniref:Helix-turn-helix transcriptional regulator n=1 Tax=Limnobaculum xujianqingii TaxID=2738837 RepID=A0A9D7AM72_9GAMM|nr:helix-turn-helix transcriptional regulator [Limnobaculum xujianqingii]MBK5075197.1 helix-turn-helix transcriptional regulator [Limnobaculum xujianqingii]MBK5178509.1 helix-turn-helix transcriptional regulator [Limnobaculum xujianqingii]
MQTPLRQIRKSKGLTLSEVAIATNIDVGNLSRIERGTQVTSLDKAEAISRFFDGEVTEMEILYPKKNSSSGKAA